MLRLMIFFVNIAFISANLYATELSTICSPNQTCTIDKSYQSIENNNPFSVITIKIGENYQTEYKTITNFINNSTITSTDSQTFRFDEVSSVRSNIVSFVNHGTISGGIYIGNVQLSQAIGTITNYGEMRGVWATRQQTLTINNQGTIKTNAGNYSGKAAHFFFESVGSLTIENYLIKIIESQSEFNGFTGYTNKADNKNSHLIVNFRYGNGVGFKDSNSKIIIDFDTASGFELGKAYSLSKLITNQDGVSVYTLPLSRITLKNRDFYTLTQSGDNFVINVAGGGKIINTEITELQKANIKSMNNMLLNTNASIFPQRFTKGRVANRPNPTNQKRVIRRQRVGNLFYKDSSVDSPNAVDFMADSGVDSNIDSLNMADSGVDSSIDSSIDSQADSPNNALLAFESLQSNETFFYDSTNATLQLANDDANTRAIRLRRLPSKNQYRINQSINRNNQAKATNRAIRPANQDKDTYHFILTPFVNHNHYFEAGNYNLSGLDYGFISAFSGKVASNNSLGVHLGFSYGTLSDKNDKLFSASNINIMVGLNYKLDLIWDMYLKARGDFFYFINEVSSEQIAKTKADNVGFGVSLAYGKDFDFGNAGVLGAEIGIDYKGFFAKDLSIKSAFDNTNMQNYDKALYHLIYADLGLNYNKYFSSSAGLWGVNAGIGIRGNLTAQLAKSKVSVSENTINVVLDNDKIFGYANAGFSYALNAKSFDMEFSLSYLGSFGNRAMSNGGGFEWSVRW